jgi:hypothetical protein
MSANNSYRAHLTEVVASWVDEGKYYTHANNSCVAEKQVVWRRLAVIGCAQASCASGATLTLGSAPY